MTKFLDYGYENDVSVTKFLDGNPYFNQAQGTDVHNRNVNMTIIQFLNTLADNGDISVTKFLNNDQMVTQRSNGDINMTIIEFLDANDISVTKFLDYVDYNSDYDLSSNYKVLDFLDTPIMNFLQ